MSLLKGGSFLSQELDRWKDSNSDLKIGSKDMAIYIRRIVKEETESKNNIAKRFSKLITETRLAGHTIYFVSKKGKWCLRFNYIYRDGKSVAFFEDSPSDALEKGVEFIEENRIKDGEDEYRPYRMEKIKGMNFCLESI